MRCASAGATPLAASVETTTKRMRKAAELLARLRDMRLVQRRGRWCERRPRTEHVPRALKIKIDHRCDEKREQLRDHEPADDGKAERAAQLGARAETDGNRQCTHDGGHGRHHD